MLPGSSGEFFRSCVKAPSAAELEKHRRVWVAMFGDGTLGWSTVVPGSLPANVSKEEFDAHHLTHPPFRSWCDHCVKGRAVDDALRPRIGPHRGEAKMGMD